LCVTLLSAVVKAFQEYVEPEEATPSSPQRRGPAAAGDDESVLLPLGDNILTHNLGIPVLIVCTKVGESDQIIWPVTLGLVIVAYQYNTCNKYLLNKSQDSFFQKKGLLTQNDNVRPVYK